MLNFTIIKSQKSARVTIYNSDGKEVGVCSSLFGAYSYFDGLCKDLDCKSVTYTHTSHDDVLLVNLK